MDAPALSAPRSFDGPACAVHAWPLADGACRICDARHERGLTPQAPAPPVDTWPRALRVEVLRLLELRQTQHPMTDADARRHASWCLWLRGAAEDLGVIPSRGAPVPIADVYDRLLTHLKLGEG